MKRTLATFTLALAASTCCGAEDSVVLGRAISQRGIDGVEMCEADEVCLGGWVRWEIRVRHALSGPTITGRIRAATTQTSLYTPTSVKLNRAFILRPIEDPAKRKLLGADFYLLGHSVPKTMYCFDGQ